MDSSGRLERLIPATSEAAYDRLTCYRFAQRYVEGKKVADIGWREIGYGSHLLAETAESLTELTNSSEAVGVASTIYPAPNASYREVALPELPYPEDHFDVVVAFGLVDNLEHPGDLVREAKRVSKPAGVFVISARDKQTHANDRNRPNSGSGDMYVPEFRELLERHFKHVRIYRQGAVAGGFVIPVSEEITSTAVESVRFALTNPYISAEPPTTGSVIAVCSDIEVSEQEEQSYLLLDRDSRVFDECEDRAEDVGLLRDEIRRMQETEVQSFQDSLKLHRTEIAYLRAQIRRSKADSNAEIRRLKSQIHRLENQMENQIHRLENHIREMEESTTWRIFEPYRRLRARMNSKKERPPEGTEGSGGDRSG
jgi:SAM-dependent methyltransferase